MQLDGALYQIGVVVRDLAAGMAAYERLLGLGPWRRIDTRYRARYREWTGTIANRNAFARWGESMFVEIVEPGEGQGNAREWLQTRGEGIFHLGYATDDLDQRPGGVGVCFETLDNRTAAGRPAVIHLDTVAQLGYFVELADRAFVQRLNAWIAGASAETGD